MVAINGVLADWMSEHPAYSIKGALPFVLGKTYKRRDGLDVKIVEINDQGDCVRGDDSLIEVSGWRYSRPGDHGRCTGTSHDLSDPRNLLPEFPPEMPVAPEGFFIQVSLLSANKPLDVKLKFAQLVMLEHKVTELRYEAMGTNNWKGVYEEIFSPMVIERIQALTKELNFNFTVSTEHTGDFKKTVYRFAWDFTDWLEELRVFYA